jgi:putative DNA primase/helicase
MDAQYEPLTLPDLFQKAKKDVYEELDRQKVKGKTPQTNNVNAKIPDCLTYILNEKPKTDNTNFNKLILNLVTGFQMAGYNYQTALGVALPFLTEYPYSTAYPASKDRINHFRTEWEYLWKNPDYKFNCSFILGLGFPGSAFECKKCGWFKEESGEEKVSQKSDEPSMRSHAESEKVVRDYKTIPPNESLLIFNLTDSGNAECFRKLYGHQYTFVFEKKRWFRDNGIRWEDDNERVILKMLDTIRERGRQAWELQDLDKQKSIIKWCLYSESRMKLNSALSIAESMMPQSINSFDADPWKLCCANGAVDLKTGDLLTPKRDDWFYKSTNILYDPVAKCIRFLQFLEEIFNGDRELINFIEKAVGYLITGLTVEQVLFILYGTGANGKSVLLNILGELLGDYAITTPASTFKDNPYHDSIPNDIARMAGARFVKSIEVKEGTHLNEERIKALTGGDRISARYLHNEFFEFTPVCKFWIAVNHKPVIRGSDEAIWRRIRLIPFEVFFPPEKRDPNLYQALKAELPGILSWAVQGCLKWQTEGLEPVGKVKEATSAYRAESDLIAQFLEEKTCASTKKVKAGELYKAYESWCKEHGEFVISGTKFGKRMEEKGFIKKKDGHVYYLELDLI